MKKIINKLLENKKVKKCLFFGGIVLAVILFIILIIIRIQINNNNAPLFIPPEETERQNQVQQILVPKYTKTSTKSWENGAIFGNLNKGEIKELHFVNNFDGQATGTWNFDGLTGYVDKSMIVYIVIDDGVVVEGSMKAAFANLPKLTTISGLKYLDTSKVSDMSYLFSGNGALVTVDEYELKTDSLTNAEYMFNDCVLLQEIDISTMNLSNLINADGMFKNTYSLKTLSLAPMQNVRTMKNMFEFAGNGVIGGLVISGTLTMGNCINATEMFKNSLIQVDYIESLRPLSLEVVSGMFYNTSFSEIDLSGWDMSSVVDASYMFADNIMLQNVNLNNWNMSAIKNIEGMFSGCYNTLSIKLDWQEIGAIHSAKWLFEGCTRLKEIDMPAFNNVKIGNAQEMFLNCSQLEKIYCTEITADASDRMFYGCIALYGYDENACDSVMANSENGYFSKKEG